MPPTNFPDCLSPYVRTVNSHRPLTAFPYWSFLNITARTARLDLSRAYTLHTITRLPRGIGAIVASTRLQRMNTCGRRYGTVSKRDSPIRYCPSGLPQRRHRPRAASPSPQSPPLPIPLTPTHLLPPPPPKPLSTLPQFTLNPTPNHLSSPPPPPPPPALALPHHAPRRPLRLPRPARAVPPPAPGPRPGARPRLHPAARPGNGRVHPRGHRR